MYASFVTAWCQKGGRGHKFPKLLQACFRKNVEIIAVIEMYCIESFLKAFLKTTSSDSYVFHKINAYKI